MNYIILTASAVESNRLQHDRWIPSSTLVPVSLLAMGALKGEALRGLDLFYTDGALDALVSSASIEGRAWEEWRAERPKFAAVRPFVAWEYLHESTIEELEERGRSNLARISSATKMDAGSASLSYLDLVNFERRHCAAAVRAIASERLVRIAAGRIVITEEQFLGRVTVRATWTALAAADRRAPEWLAGGLDNQSSVREELAL